MLKRSSVSTWLALLAAVLLWAAPVMAQSFYGALLAVVKDDQGGVLPGVTVVIVNQATGERREAVSTEDGSARFTNLVPGPYRVEAELTGFQRWVREGIVVNVQTTPRIDVTLALGSLAETITVTGQSPLLQTQSASVATTVGARAVQEMPLNGRNVLNLISLAPSVVPQGGADGSLTGKNVFAAGNYQIGGGTANQSASFFDGVTVQDTAYGNIVVLTPSPDSVEEFSVQTNSSSAEFGRFTGGVVNMASRSGSNAFRGSLFEFHRNRELNSNTYFGEKAGLEKPPFKQNNFGGTIGGPVLRDKLFFFSSYEGYRNQEGILLRRTVPTPAMRGGRLLRLPQPDHRRGRADLRPVDAVRHQQPRHRGLQRRLRHGAEPPAVPRQHHSVQPHQLDRPLVAGLPDLRRPDRVGPVDATTTTRRTPRSAATTTS